MGTIIIIGTALLIGWTILGILQAIRIEELEDEKNRVETELKITKIYFNAVCECIDKKDNMIEQLEKELNK